MTTTTTTTDGRTCSSCPWWLADDTSVPIGQPDGLPTDGQCRRFPPSRSDGQWPTTNSDEWCGEHPERRPVDD